MKRRPFIKHTAALSVGALLSLKCKAEKMKEKQGVGDFGLQLWSVREAMSKDARGTLETLAKIGYTDVECAGYSNGTFYGMTKEEYKKMLDDIGLKQMSGHTHTGFNRGDNATHHMNDRWEQVCEDAAFMGQKSIVCGYFFEDERKTIDDYKRFAELFNRCGEKAKEYGLSFGHHNHDFEFFELDGQVPYDVLLAETDADKVMFELDLYWIRKGKADYKEYFKKHAGRFPVWHVKDMDDTEEQFFAEVGSGVIDWNDVFAHQAQSGMQYFYVEQDAFKSGDPIGSVTKSHNYLKTLEV